MTDTAVPAADSKITSDNACAPQNTLLHIINNNRIAHGYTTKRFRAYKTFCNRLRRTPETEETLKSALQIESALSKYQIFHAPHFLSKARRALRKLTENDFTRSFINLYSLYLHCLTDAHNGRLAPDALQALRPLVADAPSLIPDLYAMDSAQAAEFSIAHAWHDVPLQFETQADVEDFERRCFQPRDNRFMTLLICHIQTGERLLADFVCGLEAGAGIRELVKRVRKLREALAEMTRFFEDNFVESEHAQALERAVTALEVRVCAVSDYVRGSIASDIAEWQIPPVLAEHTAALRLLEKYCVVSPLKLRERLLGAAEQELLRGSELAVMPFPPVFYDLAFDFIQYPAISDETSFLGRFKFL